LEFKPAGVGINKISVGENRDNFEESGSSFAGFQHQALAVG
jgi:hypothetical protein